MERHKINSHGLLCSCMLVKMRIRLVTTLVNNMFHFICLESRFSHLDQLSNIDSRLFKLSHLLRELVTKKNIQKHLVSAKITN